MIRIYMYEYNANEFVPKSSSITTDLIRIYIKSCLHKVNVSKPILLTHVRICPRVFRWENCYE